MRDSLMIFGLVLLSGALLTLIIEGLGKAKVEVEQIENENLRFALLQLIDTVRAIVGSINQTVVKPLKESPELNWDKAAQDKVLREAIDEIKKNLDAKSLEILKDKYEDLDKILSHFVEAEVRKQKVK